jgi:hypothetical protein
MIQPLQKALLERLSELCELSEDIRFGQMLDFLSLLVSANSGQSLAEVEDSDLLRIIDRHRDALKRRQAAVMPAGAADPACASSLPQTHAK